MVEDSYLTVAGRNIVFEIESVKISDLEYYPQNPRINSLLEQYGNASQEEIQKAMWENLEYITHDLYQDIKKNGGLQEEIIVYNQQVLEGNCRLCAYRYLSKNEPEVTKWQKIRCKVIKSDLNDKEINTLLCQQHIKGKKNWDPFEKAAYMFRMKEKDGYSFEEIAELTNISKNDVKKHISAYEFMKSEGVPDIKKFSYYLELEKNQNLSSIKKSEPDIKKKISLMIQEDRIPDAQAMRKVHIIYSDKKARAKFEKSGEDFDIALGIAKSRNPSIDDTFYRKIDEVANLLRDASPEQIRLEVEEDNHKKHKIKNLAKHLKNLCRNIELDF
ncbi:sigma-70 region 4 domain-containing protein [Methanolobus chelungpuianus]|uniref:Uncharacterized protein n=1 Tax=Methanolobus chelungpuianus TaxID=502115 RepID=A0AAE3KWI0_9EURY|nr:sigma-70 region 4 domain-containing protein [Methanolobus chelungpuianus]MCQ6962435.1 hypothetical protein [Methanolobus chelungpuianus]